MPPLLRSPIDALTLLLRAFAALLTRAQHEIYARRPDEAMHLQALLMRDFSRMRTPLAQGGLEMLREVHEEDGQEQLLRFGRYMATLDKEASPARACLSHGTIKLSC